MPPDPPRYAMLDLLEPAVKSKQVRHCLEVQLYVRKLSYDVHTSGSTIIWERQRDRHRNTIMRKEKERNRGRPIVGRETLIADFTRLNF